MIGSSIISKFVMGLLMITLLFYTVHIADAVTVTLLPNSSIENNGSIQTTTGKNKYATSLMWSQTEIPKIYLNRSEHDSLSAWDSVYVTSAGNKKQDSYLSVNFTLPGVETVNWLKIRSIAYVVGDEKDTVHLGLWNDTFQDGGGWNGLNNTVIRCPFVNLTFNVTNADEISKFTTIDVNKNLNFSMALWTNGVHSSNLSVDLFEAIIDYTPAIQDTEIFINGTVKDSDTKDGIEDVIVSTNTSILTITDASGFYSITITQGAYELTAALQPVYYTNSSVSVYVASGVVVQDIEIQKKPEGTISGTVKSSEN